MIRHLSSITALFLLSFITLKAHPLFTYYGPGSDSHGNVSTPNTSVDHMNFTEPCTELNSESFESSFGIWIDGGSNCARSTSFPNTGSWSVELRAGVGLTSSMYTPAMDFSNMGITLAFSFYPQGYDSGEGFVLEYATDVNGTYTGFTAWVLNTHFQNNTRYNVTVNMNTVTWTANSRLRLRSVASLSDEKVYIDDVVISNCCDIGAPCNDGSQCTINDVINANCECAGTFQDSDGDGTCDAFDICPGVDDYLIISEAPCDDGDPCTIGDHMDDDVCGCAGQYTDWDQDGYCIAEDPDDLDACNPDPENPACNPCVTHDYAHFESSFGNWNSGGNDCSRVYAPQYAYAGNYCVRIQDNSGAASAMFSDNFNLAGLNNVSVSFSYIAVSMESGEDFILEVSTNGGGSYTAVESWSSGTDFQNNSRQFVFVPVNGVTWTSQSRFRIRCDASANDDRVYIDDVYIRSCLNFPAMQVPVNHDLPTIFNDIPVSITDAPDVILSPNPVNTELQIHGIKLDGATIEIFNLSGNLLDVELNGPRVDVSHLPSGLYLMRIKVADQFIVKRFVKE